VCESIAEDVFEVTEDAYVRPVMEDPPEGRREDQRIESVVQAGMDRLATPPRFPLLC
jgi:hypothetical protein